MCIMEIAWTFIMLIISPNHLWFLNAYPLNEFWQPSAVRFGGTSFHSLIFSLCDVCMLMGVAWSLAVINQFASSLTLRCAALRAHKAAHCSRWAAICNTYVFNIPPSGILIMSGLEQSGYNTEQPTQLHRLHLDNPRIHKDWKIIIADVN